MKTVLEIQKENINLVSIIESAGIELKRTGLRYVGFCPFHTEKNPSFYVFDDGRFKCFGCSEYGDVIDFAQKFYSLSFTNALKHLGIKQGRMLPNMKHKIRQHKRRSELIKEFRKWKNRYLAYLGTMIIKTEKLMIGIRFEDLDLYAPLLHMLPIWEHHSDILLNGTDEEKYRIYKEARKNGKF